MSILLMQKKYRFVKVAPRNFIWLWISEYPSALLMALLMAGIVFPLMLITRILSILTCTREDPTVSFDTSEIEDEKIKSLTENQPSLLGTVGEFRIVVVTVVRFMYLTILPFLAIFYRAPFGGQPGYFVSRNDFMSWKSFTVFGQARLYQEAPKHRTLFVSHKWVNNHPDDDMNSQFLAVVDHLKSILKSNTFGWITVA